MSTTRVTFAQSEFELSANVPVALVTPVRRAASGSASIRPRPRSSTWAWAQADAPIDVHAKDPTP